MKKIPDFLKGIIRDPRQLNFGADAEIREVNYEPPELDYNPILEAELAKFASSLDRDPETVYYPFCGKDITPERAFPDSHVIFVDNDANCINALKNNKRDVRQASAIDWLPAEKIDVLVLVNPGSGVPIEYSLEALKEQGNICCTDYHSVATRLARRPDLEIKKIIIPAKDDKSEAIEITENLEDYFSPVSTDEEWQQAETSRFQMSYENARKVLASLVTNSRNILYDYETLLEYIKRENPEQDFDIVPIITYQGQTLMRMPNKKLLAKNYLVVFGKK